VGSVRSVRHLVIFLRAPQRGAVKRRLARDIGERAALGFYQDMSRSLVTSLGHAKKYGGNWQTVLAVTPDHFASSARFWPKGIRRVGQGRGSLGARMGRVLDQLPPGPAIIIGSDIPNITPPLIKQAFDRLDQHEAVFGPAMDGGYWLVGLGRRRRRFVGRLFSSVRWSSPHALADTRANLGHGLEGPPLAALEDVDDGAAFERWVQGAHI
jgi:rSAM/selenodomain-associated transferase 1